MPTTRVRATFTRQQLAAALTEADRPTLAELLYSRRLDQSEGGGMALAMDFDDPGELATALVTIGRMPDIDALDFAAALRFALPGHPSERASQGAYWPGFVLAEPTVEQWWDLVNACPVCVRLGDDGPCLAHERAPWQADVPAGVS